MFATFIGLYAATVTAMVLKDPCKKLLHYIQHCKCGVCQPKNGVKELLN